MIDMLISKCAFAEVSLKLAAGDGVAATQVCLMEVQLFFLFLSLPLLLRKLRHGKCLHHGNPESLFLDQGALSFPVLNASIPQVDIWGVKMNNEQIQGLWG